MRNRCLIRNSYRLRCHKFLAIASIWNANFHLLFSCLKSEAFVMCGIKTKFLNAKKITQLLEMQQCRSRKMKKISAGDQRCNKFSTNFKCLKQKKVQFENVMKYNIKENIKVNRLRCFAQSIIYCALLFSTVSGISRLR